VAVAAPSGGMQIHLDITASRRGGTELHDGIPEIRTGFMVPEPRMKNPDGTAVQSFQPVPLQSLVRPDLLQYPFRRDRLARVAKSKRHSRLGAPVGVKVGRDAAHLGVAFQPGLLQSQAHRARRAAERCIPKLSVRGSAAFRLRVAPPSSLRYDAIAPEAKAEKRRSRLGEASGAARVGATAVRPLQRECAVGVGIQRELWKERQRSGVNAAVRCRQLVDVLSADGPRSSTEESGN